MILAALMLACRDKTPDTQDSAATPDVVRAETLTVTSDREGYATVPVEIAEGEIFHVVGARSRGWLSVDYVYAPSGDAAFDWEDWYEGPRSLTDACFPTDLVTAVNWPVRSEDGPLEAGTWNVKVAALTAQGSYQSGADIDVTILRRLDTALDSGTLRVVIAYAGGLEEDGEVVGGTEEAVEHWRGIYAARGVTLEPTFTTIDTDGNLPDTYQGLEEVEAFGEALAQRSVIVVVGDKIGGDTSLYGEAGGIPGPYVPAQSGAVFVSWLANAGADARFSPSDVLLYGETMAHEVGHYLGLFHPVEADYRHWDALADTEECGGWRACDDGLGANLMYPYPVCTGATAGSCVRQTVLSDAQSGVVHRWIGVE
jgi:hypothetical protein